MCPCDGTLPESDYATVVDQLVTGVTEDPGLLLTPLVEKMHRFSLEQRFEEAAWVRDRHDALASAIQRRQAWTALLDAGRIELEDTSGIRLVVDQGRFAGATTDETLPVVADQGASDQQVPDSVQTAEEADLIWKWLSGGGLRLIEASYNFALPLNRPQRLSQFRPKAA